MDHRKEIDRLYALDYGEPIELTFRMFLTACTALILFNYTGLTISLFWFLGFALSHAFYFTILKTRPKICTEIDTNKAGMMYLVLLAAFIWLPAWLITHEDVALRITGTAGTGAFLISLIHRGDRMKWMVYGEIVIVAMSVGLVLGTQSIGVTDGGARAVMAFACVALLAYFAQTMLQHRVQRLDAEATAVRSIQAQKMEAVGQLAGGIAHDFNNILTAVTGNLELYEVIDDPKDRAEFIRDAKIAAERAAGLVQQLLAYSRKSTLSVADYSVSRIFDQVQALSTRLLPASVSLAFDTPEDQMRVRVDQNQLITALINLIVNARDAMGNAGTLTVTAAPRVLEEPVSMFDGAVLDPGRFVEIAVTDNGPGIPAHILRRVTEPFFTTKEIGKGSGLGLSMVEGFARQSKGGLVIDTSPEGTTIRILLPCATPLVAAQDPAPAGATPGLDMDPTLTKLAS